MFLRLVICGFLVLKTFAQNVFCPVANGDVPNAASEGCVTYFRCVNYYPVLLRCARGEQFHFDKARCMIGRDVNCTAQLQRFVASKSSPFDFENDTIRDQFLSHFRYSRTVPKLQRNNTKFDGNNRTLPEIHRKPQSVSSIHGKIGNGPSIFPQHYPVSVPKQGTVTHRHILSNGQVITHKHSAPLAYSVINGRVVARVLPHQHVQVSQADDHEGRLNVASEDHPVSLPKQGKVTHQHLLPNGTVVTHRETVPLTYFLRNGNVVARVLPHSRLRNVIANDHPVYLPQHTAIRHQHVFKNGTSITHRHTVPVGYWVRKGNVVGRVLPHTHAVPVPLSQRLRQTPTTNNYNAALANSLFYPVQYVKRMNDLHRSAMRGSVLYSGHYLTPTTYNYNAAVATSLLYPNVLAAPPTAVTRRTKTGDGRVSAVSSLYPNRLPNNQRPRLIDDIDINSNDYRRRLG